MDENEKSAYASNAQVHQDASQSHFKESTEMSSAPDTTNSTEPQSDSATLDEILSEQGVVSITKSRESPDSTMASQNQDLDTCTMPLGANSESKMEGMQISTRPKQSHISTDQHSSEDAEPHPSSLLTTSAANESAAKDHLESCDKELPLPTANKTTSEEAEDEPDEPDEPEKDIYHVKWIKFKGRQTAMVTQNINGPCPLLAIVNVLLLQGKITLLISTAVITSGQLMSLLGDIMLKIPPEDIPHGEKANWEQNVNDAMTVFHKLQTGLDVNVRFTGVDSFEYTPELTVFDLLQISLYHGWLVDAALTHQLEAIGNLTYNQLVEFIIENQQSTDANLQTRALLCQQFMDETASQLTYHGLSELATQVKEDQMAVFFRNNHFSTLYKHKGELFLLVTDQGYLKENRVIWETLANVEGDGILVDCDFRSLPTTSTAPVAPSPVPANTQEQVDQDLLLAMSLEATEAENLSENLTVNLEETDEELAKRLQEEEDRRAAAVDVLQQEEQSSERGAAAGGAAAPSRPTAREGGRSKKNKDSCTLL